MNMPMGGLGALQPQAQQAQSAGRGNDTMLVHMTPDEVNSLHGLAMHFGGGLTINPETGLPEAGFLGKLLPKLLPMVLGAGLMATGIGAPAAAGLVGAGAFAKTGSLKKGLLAGLSAYGGASLAGAAGVGAAAPGAIQGAAVNSAIPGAVPAGAIGSTQAAAPALFEGGVNIGTNALPGAMTGLPGGLAGASSSAIPGATGLGASVGGAGANIGGMNNLLAQSIGSAPMSSGAIPGATGLAGQGATAAPGTSASVPGTGLEGEVNKFSKDFATAARGGPENTLVPGGLASTWAPRLAAAGVLTTAADVSKKRPKKVKEEPSKYPYYGPYKLPPLKQLGLNDPRNTGVGGGVGQRQFFEDPNPPGVIATGAPADMSPEEMKRRGFVPDPEARLGYADGGTAGPPLVGGLTSFDRNAPPPTVGGGPPLVGGLTSFDRNAPPPTVGGDAPTPPPVGLPSLPAGAAAGPSPAGGGGGQGQRQYFQDANPIKQELTPEQRGIVVTPSTDPKKYLPSITVPEGRASREQSQAIFKALGLTDMPFDAYVENGKVYDRDGRYQFRPEIKGGKPAITHSGTMPVEPTDPTRKPVGYAGGGGVFHMETGGHVIPAFDVATHGNGSTDAGFAKLARMGGIPVRGPGDGVSDSVPALIDGQHEARLANGEVYFPKAAVQRMGGNQKLYAMMDRAEKARRATRSGSPVRMG